MDWTVMLKGKVLLWVFVNTIIKFSSSTQGGKFHDLLRVYQFLKNSAAAWSYIWHTEVN